jgi:GH25 family lysozyme M1 (1,4-beta-N-acetylmuramidase)
MAIDKREFLRKDGYRTAINFHRRIKKIEDTTVGSTTVKNIWKDIEDITAVFDEVEVWAQGTGSSAVYGKATYGFSKYAPLSATEWILVRTAST